MKAKIAIIKASLILMIVGGVMIVTAYFLRKTFLF